MHSSINWKRYMMMMMMMFSFSNMVQYGYGSLKCILQSIHLFADASSKHAATVAPLAPRCTVGNILALLPFSFQHGFSYGHGFVIEVKLS